MSNIITHKEFVDRYVYGAQEEHYDAEAAYNAEQEARANREAQQEAEARYAYEQQEF